MSVFAVKQGVRGGKGIFNAAKHLPAGQTHDLISAIAGAAEFCHNLSAQCVRLDSTGSEVE
jgi:hypothetical protein